MNRLARAGLLLTGLALPALPLLAQHAGHGDQEMVFQMWKSRHFLTVLFVCGVSTAFHVSA